ISECSNDEIKYVLTCDIADFYPRIYHHRLENALDRVDPNKDYSGKIKKLLQTFSETKSYGVPVGCPASRILAELALDSIDKLLSMNRINY
ncbi:RNA-dependent DNA polymerase, partial [Escherichia coli]|nr:RNA-dependent DNA polymerase [Escherichia coli]